MKRFALIIALFSIHFTVSAQTIKRITTPEYINLYKGDAIKDMMKMGVPASITLAQGILESESGNSVLAREAKNHFGIKCHKGWTGETFHKDDDERDECFRKYKTVLESYDDHGRFLRERPRYAFLFDFEISDYKKWAHGLKQAGYATNPRYPELLIKLIEEHNLDVYDMGGKNIPVSVIVSTPPPSVSTQHDQEKETPVKQNIPADASQKQDVLFNSSDVPYLISKKGDSWYSIAVANDMRMWQILKYNDANANDLLEPGSNVYLKPKRGNPVQEFHVAKSNDTYWNISQKYGVKLKKLLKLNEQESANSISAGQKIKLR